MNRLPYKCPPAPYEAPMNLDAAFRERGVRKDVGIHVFTPEASPLRIVGPEGSAKFKAYLGTRGITAHEGETVASADPESRSARFQSGQSMDYDLLITVPVHRSAPFVKEASLLNESGWIPVDPATLATRQAGVYAIGDATVLPMPNGNPLPKVGILASGEGETVARNLVAEIQGGDKGRYGGLGYCFVDHGGGKAAAVQGEFLGQGGPQVSLASPSVKWHRRKIGFERDWRRWKF